MNKPTRQAKKSTVTKVMVTAVLPHLRDAVEANVRRLDAEREIEQALAKILGKDVEIDGILDHYDDLCAMIGDPSDAQRQVTRAECWMFLESVEDLLGVTP